MKKIAMFLFSLGCLLFSLVNSALAGINDGLVAYYPFNGNANDASGNGHNGVVNGATLTTDRFGAPNSAYYFDGLNDYISVPDDDALDLPNIKTISLWFYLQVKNGDPNNVLLNKYRADTPNEDGYTMGVNQLTKNEVFGWAKDENGHVTDLATTSSDHEIVSVPFNKWVHFVFIFNNNQTTFYVNGVALNKESGTLDISHGNNLPLIIGAGMDHYYTIYNYFKGKIDDIRIYNRVLSEPEIQELYYTDWDYLSGYNQGYADGQASVDCTDELNAGIAQGRQQCIDDPSSCDIEVGCSDTDLANARNEGYNQGYADGQVSVDCSPDINAAIDQGRQECIQNPSSCGIETGCSDSELASAREQGRQECINSPSSCGIEECSGEPISSTSYCGSYDFITNVLHIPCVEAGDTSYWLDFSYTGNGLLFDIVNYGTMFSPEQCPTLTTREECEAHSDVCRVESVTGPFGIVTGIQCVPRQ